MSKRCRVPYNTRKTSLLRPRCSATAQAHVPLTYAPIALGATVASFVAKEWLFRATVSVGERVDSQVPRRHGSELRAQVGLHRTFGGWVKYFTAEAKGIVI